MARTSRITHPAGGHFVIAHDWAIQAVGKNAALVLGELDFLDRTQTQPGEPVASRADLIQALQGLVGKNSIDLALSELEERGWVGKVRKKEFGENLKIWFEFFINAEAINMFLNNRDSRCPEIGKADVPKSVPKSGKPIKKDLYIKEEEQATSEPVENSEFSDIDVKKLFTGRGLILENPQDIHICRQLLPFLESRPDLISNAISTIRGRSTKKMPFPSTVLKLVKAMDSQELVDRSFEEAASRAMCPTNNRKAG